MNRIALACLGVLFLGCAAASADPPAADPPTVLPPTDATHGGCALGILGTATRIIDSKEGVDVTFTASDRVAELRQRVRDVAALHGPGAHLGLGHAGHHEEGQGHGLRLTDLPVGHASEEDVDLGATLHLVASSSLQVDELRSGVRARIVDLGSRSCD